MTHLVQPVYPEEAKEAQVSGTVVLHAVIAKDRTVQQLQVVSGPPLLLKSAMDAVSKWTYAPTLLQGRPVEVDTTIQVMYTLIEEPPPPSSTSAPSNMVVEPPAATSPAAAAPIPPSVPAPMGSRPLHPAAARNGQPAFPDTPDGMKAQFEAALDAWRSGDQSRFAVQLDSFAFEDPSAWLGATFGSEAGASLVSDYETSLGKFKSHIEWVSGKWANTPNLTVTVEASELPLAARASGDEAALPRPIKPLSIENFRFTLAAKDPLTSWVFSFVYVDGAFRIVGGSYPFWDEALQGMRARPTRVVLNADQVEGIAVMCPGDGLVRLFVSARDQASRAILQSPPAYPPDAIKSGTEGTVLFHAIIGKDGTVEELDLEDGDPVLAKAAEEAVRSWRYEPTIFEDRVENTERPAEVDTAIAIRFKLPRSEAK